MQSWYSDVGGAAAARAGAGRGRRRRPRGVEERQRGAAIRVVCAARRVPGGAGVRRVPSPVDARPRVRGPAVRGAGPLRLAVGAAGLRRRLPPRPAAAATLPWAGVRAAGLSLPSAPSTSAYAASSAYDGALAAAC